MESTPQDPEVPPRHGRLRTVAERLRASPAGRMAIAARGLVRDPGNAIALLLLLSMGLRVLFLNVPSSGLIFDEAYYVNAARVILGIEPTNHYEDKAFGFDPNTEHPALGKLLIAGSMALLGDNAIAWRLPSVLLGMLALLAVYLIVRDTTRSRWLPVLVTGLVSFDNLTFVHGRIGTLDILVLGPMLLGSWFALRKRWIPAGVALGIALLIKITAIYAVGAVALYWLLTEAPAWIRARRPPGMATVRGPVGFVVITMSIMLGGLTILDATLSQFPSPVDHIARIITYGANLKKPIDVGNCPEADSYPWEWLENKCQITYYRSDVTVRVGDEVTEKYAKIDFRGAMNPVLVGGVPLAAIFAAWYAWRTRNRLALWALSWGAANYLPYVLLAALTPRIMYIYYMLPMVPALAVALALLLTRSGLPRPVVWGFLVAYMIGYAAYFPFRTLP